jgi:hypothetical protein
MRESWAGVCGRAYRSAKPAAEEARPAAVGKLLEETRRRG